MYGYDENYSLIYDIPYINRRQTIGTGFAIGYARNHEVPVFTQDDKLTFYKDESSYPRTDFYAWLQLQYRQGIHQSYTLQLRYDKYHFSDSLTKYSDYSIGKAKNISYFTLYFRLKSDYRDYKPYPLQGFYFDWEFTKNGLGMLKDEHLDVFYTRINLRNYWKISPAIYFASGLSGKISSGGFQPYFLQRGLGYQRDFVRGYEYYVVDGQSFVLGKFNLKYRIIRQHICKLNFIRTEKFNKIPYAFYLNLFSDFAYVDNRQKDKDVMYPNLLPNSWLNGNGIGIDFVTYYDKVIRFEYSVNKKGESGFFIHFMTSI